MASGPWFFDQQVTINGTKTQRGVTTLRLVPPLPKPPDPPISAASWVWASVTELLNGQPHLGDAVIWVANVAPQNDGSILIKLMSTWTNDLPGLIKLLFWSVV